MRALNGFLLFIIAISCEEKVTVDRGPCPFPPPSTNFTPDYPCEDCYIRFGFLGKMYNLNGDQFTPSIEWRCDKREGCIFYEEKTAQTYSNTFFNFRIRRPNTERGLFYNLGVYTRILAPDGLFNYPGTELPASISVQNYCQENFVSNPDYNSGFQISYHRINKIELKAVTSLPTNKEFYSADYWIYGEFASEIMVNDSREIISGTYKLIMNIQELK